MDIERERTSQRVTLSLSTSEKEKIEERATGFSENQQLILARLLAAPDAPGDLSDFRSFWDSVELLRAKALRLDIVDSYVYQLFGLWGKFFLADKVAENSWAILPQLDSFQVNPNHSQLAQLLLLCRFDVPSLVPLLTSTERKLVKVLVDHNSNFVPYEDFLPVFVEGSDGVYPESYLMKNLRRNFVRVNQKMESFYEGQFHFKVKRGGVFVYQRGKKQGKSTNHPTFIPEPLLKKTDEYPDWLLDTLFGKNEQGVHHFTIKERELLADLLAAYPGYINWRNEESALKAFVLQVTKKLQHLFPDNQARIISYFGIGYLLDFESEQKTARFLLSNTELKKLRENFSDELLTFCFAPIAAVENRLMNSGDIKILLKFMINYQHILNIEAFGKSKATIRNYLYDLREKLACYQGPEKILIKTVNGVGYTLQLA